MSFMDLSTIRFIETPGRHETLALSLMSVGAGAGVQMDYDDLLAALGLSCTAISTISCLDLPKTIRRCAGDVLL